MRKLGTTSCIVVVTLLGISPCRSEDPLVGSLLVTGDDLDRKHDTRHAIDTFTEAEKRAPQDGEVLLRLSKQYSDLASESKDPVQAQKAAWTALHYAERAVELMPNNAKAHLSLAISYGKLTDFVSNRTKVEYSKLIRDETLKSIELDPTDDFGWHVLGRWHYGVANLNPALRILCKLVYGGLPQASNEQAIENLKKAAEIAPQRIIHHAELAKAYVAAGQVEQARGEWKTVLSLPSLDAEDEKAKEAAREGLK